jgi:hypothetical protein
MTGMPHRPSSTDGHPSVSLLIAIARPIGYAYTCFAEPASKLVGITSGGPGSNLP